MRAHRPPSSATLAALALLAGCSASVAASPDAAPALDAPGTDAVCAPATSAARPPECLAEGCTLAPLAFHECTAAEPRFVVPQAAPCAAEATVLELVAAWCTACQRLAPLLQQGVTERYGGRVALVSVLVQDPDFGPPTIAACDAWRAMYGLTGAVVFDPNAQSAVLAPTRSFPARVLLDRDGVIRYRAYGTGVGLAELQAQIDLVLAGP